jgi:hypothetical protein
VVISAGYHVIVAVLVVVKRSLEIKIKNKKNRRMKRTEKLIE